MIRRSIKKQLPGLLPPQAVEEEEAPCRCRKPFVEMERKPGLRLKYAPMVRAVESTATQTELSMAELDVLVRRGEERLATLEVAVQTLEVEGGGRRKESDVEKQLESTVSAER